METFHNEVKTLRKKNQKKQDKTVEGSSKTNQNKERPSWLTNHEKPKPEDSKRSRQWNGKVWWWCDKSTGGKCDGKWRIHNPSECKGYTPKSDQKTKPKQGKKRSIDALKLTNANEAIIKKTRFETNGEDSE